MSQDKNKMPVPGLPEDAPPGLPTPPARKDDAPNFEKVEQKDCTHTGYYVPMGYDSFPVAGGDAVLVSFGIICMRCGKIWPHVQLLESPLAKLGKESKLADSIVKP